MDSYEWVRGLSRYVMISAQDNAFFNKFVEILSCTFAGTAATNRVQGQDTPSETLTCVAIAYVANANLNLPFHRADSSTELGQDVSLHLNFPSVVEWSFMIAMPKS